jgi:hypothetical protein
VIGSVSTLVRLGHLVLDVKVEMDLSTLHTGFASRFPRTRENGPVELGSGHTELDVNELLYA